MLVVSDSSPLNVLIRMRIEGVLPRLFSAVCVPPTVLEKLGHLAAPSEVRAFATQPPAWLVVKSPTSIERIARLDAGEEAAISLARELRADAILMDERAGRLAAQALGLRPIGLLGVLDRADARGIVDFVAISGDLPADFRVEPSLLESVLDRCRARRRGG